MKKRIIQISAGIVMILTIAFIITFNENYKESITTSSTALSNTRIGWGVKRVPNNEQPDLGATNVKLMEQYNGIAMGNKDKKYVYLTFDGGYEAGYTEKILDALKENDVKATFFITGHYLNTAGDIVQRMVNEGHVVGNHTVNHHSMPDLSEEEIKEEVVKLQTAVYEKTGYEMRYIRPPKGEYSERTLAITNNLGYTTVMWSLAYDDWDEAKQGRTEYGKEKILANIHPGAVILLHSTSKDNSEILSEVIKKVKEMGYEFKSIDQFER